MPASSLWCAAWWPPSPPQRRARQACACAHIRRPVCASSRLRMLYCSAAPEPALVVFTSAAITTRRPPPRGARRENETYELLYTHASLLFPLLTSRPTPVIRHAHRHLADRTAVSGLWGLSSGPRARGGASARRERRENETYELSCTHATLYCSHCSRHDPRRSFATRTALPV